MTLSNETTDAYLSDHENYVIEQILTSLGHVRGRKSTIETMRAAEFDITLRAKEGTVVKQ